MVNCRLSISSLLLHGTLFTVVVLGGCTNDNPLNRQCVSGQVTLDRNPLAQGIIEFSSQQPGGTGSGTTIKDGHYAIETDRGLPPGNYLVRLYSSSTGGNDSASSDGMSIPGPSTRGKAIVARERIPSQYNTKSNLIVEIKADKTNTYDFHVNTN